MNKAKGLNWNVFSWQEIVDALKDKNNWLHDTFERWFSEWENYKDEEENEEDIVLYFGEDCIEISYGEYFLVNFKEDWAYSIHDLSEIEERLNDYEKDKEEDKQ